MDIVTVKKGEVDLEIKVEQGQVKLEVKYDGLGANASVIIALESDYFLEKLAKAIPGELDDAVISLIKSALKG